MYSKKSDFVERNTPVTGGIKYRLDVDEDGSLEIADRRKQVY